MCGYWGYRNRLYGQNIEKILAYTRYCTAEELLKGCQAHSISHVTSQNFYNRAVEWKVPVYSWGFLFRYGHKKFWMISERNLHRKYVPKKHLLVLQKNHEIWYSLGIVCVGFDVLNTPLSSANVSILGTSFCCTVYFIWLFLIFTAHLSVRPKSLHSVIVYRSSGTWMQRW